MHRREMNKTPQVVSGGYSSETSPTRAQIGCAEGATDPEATTLALARKPPPPPQRSGTGFLTRLWRMLWMVNALSPLLWGWGGLLAVEGFAPPRPPVNGSDHEFDSPTLSPHRG